MTNDDVLYAYRLRVLASDRELGSVAAACRLHGIHRSTYYLWKNAVNRFGCEILRPRGRRAPQMPNSIPVLVEQLALAATNKSSSDSTLARVLVDLDGPCISSLRSLPPLAPWTQEGWVPGSREDRPRAGLTSGSPPDCGGRSGSSGETSPPVCNAALSGVSY